MNIITYIFSILYFCLPAYLLNMAPPIYAKLKIFNFLAKPIDLNKKFLGNPILGHHKTYRGAICSFVTGFLVVLAQQWLYRLHFFQKISILNYYQSNVIWFALLISSGAIFGDLLFAFIKRRIGLQPGAVFLPFDQINYIIGAYIFTEHFFHIGLLNWIVLIILTFFLHLFVNYLGFLLKISQNKF